MKKLLVAFICASLGMGSACAATFDCTKARTFPAKTICKNPELNALDDQFGQIYAQVAEKTDNSESFKQIGRANVALRNLCKDEACVKKWLDDSINLYSYLLYALRPDPMAQFPKDVQELCENALGSMEQGECASARLSFLDKKIENTLKEIQSLNVPEEEKQESRKIFEKGKKDREEYCRALETIGVGTSISGVIGGCEVEWTQKIEEMLDIKLGYMQEYVEANSDLESQKND